MLRILFLIVTLTLYQNIACAQHYTRADVVMDIPTGRIIHAYNADVPIYPASLTKIMTLYLIFEALEQKKLTKDQKLIVSPYAFRQIPSKIWLLPKSTITVHQAIQMLIVKSANDVAVVVAEALADSEPHFAQKMTEKAIALGMKHTAFHNASGLPNQQQRSTAHDIALLSRALILNFPQYIHYFSQTQLSYQKKTYQTHNRLLYNVKSGIYGLKTGFIRSSGFNISVAAKQGHTNILAVVIGEDTASARNQKTLALLEDAFQHKKQQRHLLLSSLDPQHFFPPKLSPQQRRYAIQQVISQQKLVRLIPPSRALFAKKEQKLLSTLLQERQNLNQHHYVLSLTKPQGKPYQNKYSFLDHPIPIRRIVFIHQEQKLLAFLKQKILKSETAYVHPPKENQNI